MWPDFSEYSEHYYGQLPYYPFHLPDMYIPVLVFFTPQIKCPRKTGMRKEEKTLFSFLSPSIKDIFNEAGKNKRTCFLSHEYEIQTQALRQGKTSKAVYFYGNVLKIYCKSNFFFDFL